MKITAKALNIPPYISTSWNNILSLSTETKGSLFILIIRLRDGTSVEIPNLDPSLIENVFETHAKHLDQSNVTPSLNTPPMGVGFPIQFGMEGMDSFGSAMQHNPSQATAPDLPADILDKIVAISKIIGSANPEDMPKPEPDCNCFYCQIAKAFQGSANPLDEEVTEHDLTFRTWDIKEINKDLYSVSNPLNPEEKYTVFLGNPIGCTCGQQNCEHIKAVLNT